MGPAGYVAYPMARRHCAFSFCHGASFEANLQPLGMWVIPIFGIGCEDKGHNASVERRAQSMSTRVGLRTRVLLFCLLLG